MEQLIEELVAPTSRPSPARVLEIQKEIQRLQRQPTGWNLGIALLKKSSSQLRFYGALTLIVKIQTDWASVETQPGLHDAVLTQLLASYVDVTNQSEEPFVLRKVCSTLVAFFLRSNRAWEFPVRHVLAALCSNQIPRPNDVVDFHTTWAQIQRIHPKQLRSVLWLSSSLIEEVMRVDVTGTKSAQMVDKVTKNARDVWQLTYLTLASLLSRNGSFGEEFTSLSDHLRTFRHDEEAELSREALYTASLWMKFHPSPIFSDESINAVLNDTVPLILRSFFVSGMADDTISCLTSISQQAPKYLAITGTGILNSLLTSPRAESYVMELLQGNFETEAIHFVAFITSLLDIYDLSSPDAFHDETLKIVLAILKNLLHTPGIPVIIDEVCQMVLDAFNQIADRWSDWVGTDPTDEDLRPLISTACMQYSVKIQFPPERSDRPYSSWETDERSQFQDFRHDVEDLLLASYACIGPDLVTSLAATLQSSDLSSSWEIFEARLYCLGAVSDVVHNNLLELGPHVLGVLASPKWNFLLQNVNNIPDRARQGAISFISRNTIILQQYHQHLVPYINFLFASLHIPGSSTSASRAIFTLCHKLRPMLVEALVPFIDTISILTDIPSEETHRLFRSVAAIIQAIPTEEGKVGPLARIINILSQPSEARAGQPSGTGLIFAVDLLQTLAAVGKGLRAPPEAPVNLEAQPSLEEERFWVEGYGKHIQQNVQGVMDHFLAEYPYEPLIIEAACDILKSGYTEAHPSPFRFDCRYSASFFAQRILLDSPRIGLVIDSASSFLASHVSHPDTIGKEFLQVSSAITWSQRALLESFAATKTYEDHEFTHSSLEYFSHILPHYGYYFSDRSFSEAWQINFEFALLALENPDTLPRRSSAQFWVRKSLSLPTANTTKNVLHKVAIFNQFPSLSHEASRNLLGCIQHYGSRFVATLLRLLGGGAARSELDLLCEPLKKLMGKHGLLGAKLLREAAAREGGEHGKNRRFVEQVIGLRGGRKTGEVVKDFWVGSRGAAFAYAG